MESRRTIMCVTAMVALGCSGEAWGGGCSPEWSSRFGGAGVNGSITDSIVYDDGTGPALYVGGDFASIAGISASRVARWDGNRWTPLGTGVNDVIFAVTVFDPDGLGGAPPTLVVGGWFTTAGGISAKHVAKWNGSQWSPLGSGMANPGGVFPKVEALSVLDEDGAGPAPARLFAGGWFTIAGGIQANRIARWDGVNWSAVGTGMSGNGESAVYTLEAIDADGPGPAFPEMFAGGFFLSAGGVPVNHIARWNGSAWNRVGIGINNGVDGDVRSLASFDDGTGTALYVGGNFASAGGAPAPRIARWNGSAWSAVGDPGFSFPVSSLSAFDDGSGPSLFAGANGIKTWNPQGGTWTAPGGGVDGAVLTLTPFQDTTGCAPRPGLFAAGEFNAAGGIQAGRHALFVDGAWWNMTGGPINAVNDALVTDLDGAGSQSRSLVIVGDFDAVERTQARRIAAWDGVEWSPLGAIEGASSPTVRAVFAKDSDGDGPAAPLLYVGGKFDTVDGQPASNVAARDAAVWSSVGSGLWNGTVEALAFYDDGSGDSLYAGGNFSLAGGLAARNVARWNGTVWEAVATLADGVVYAFATFDDGDGAKLYVGGDFQNLNSTTSPRIARWGPDGWEAVTTLASFPTIFPRSLLVFDDGVAGNALYWSGTGGIVYRYQQGAWTQVGGYFQGTSDAVNAMCAFDADGPGPGQPRLHASGAFDRVCVRPPGWMPGDPLVCTTTNHVAWFDGVAWQPLAPAFTSGEVFALATFNDSSESAPALYFGGAFGSVAGLSALNIARWGCPIPSSVTVLDQPDDETSTAGGTASFEAEAAGIGAPIFMWRFEGFPLSDGPLPGGGSVSGTSASQLTLIGVQEADEGQYDVEVSDACGTIVSLAATLSVVPPLCPGDADGNGNVNFSDITSVLANFGDTGAPGIPGDADGNGIVTFGDVTSVLANFGNVCP